MKAVLQILLGLASWIAIAVWLIYSNFSFFWESRYPDGSNPITWRSDMVLLLLLVITQGISFLLFRRIRLHGRRPLTGTIASQPYGPARTPPPHNHGLE